MGIARLTVVFVPVNRAQIVIAVDGPSGSGKSSTARGVATRLGLRYLDTGAMYRAIAWWVRKHGVENVAARIAEPDLAIGTDPAAPTIAVDGVDVTDAIRSREVTETVSTVAAVPEVRERMVALQRALIGDGGVVVEGRDIGTTVVPDAELKIFLTADAEERARRRSAEGLTTTSREMTDRDQRDAGRAASPMKRADDAIDLDTTAMTLDQAVDRIAALASER